MNELSDPNDELPDDPVSRVFLVIYALLLWALAGWIFWIINKFANGRGWWDFAVKLVLHEFTLAIFLAGCGFVIHAFFPHTVDKLIGKTLSKIIIWVVFIGVFSFAAVVFVAIIVPLLRMVGLL